VADADADIAADFNGSLVEDEAASFCGVGLATTSGTRRTSQYHWQGNGP
jgi:hypothetical protein